MNHFHRNQLRNQGSTFRRYLPARRTYSDYRKLWGRQQPLKGSLNYLNVRFFFLFHRTSSQSVSLVLLYHLPASCAPYLRKGSGKKRLPKFAQKTNGPKLSLPYVSVHACAFVYAAASERVSRGWEGRRRTTANRRFKKTHKQMV